MPACIRPPAPSLERRLREFWAHLDAKDGALLATMIEDAKRSDDLAKGWLRGHAAIGEHFARIGQRSEPQPVAGESTSTTTLVASWQPVERSHGPAGQRVGCREEIR